MPAASAIEQRLAGLRFRDVLVFALLLGVSSTFFSPYRYGFVNHIEQLPPILRALDPGVMPGDETVDELCTFGPRFYYVNLIAGLARVMPLPAVYLMLTILAHSATALVTLLTARRLFAGSMLTAMLAATLVVSVSSIGIGGASHLFRAQLVPQTLATPLLLGSLALAFLMRPHAAMLLALPGCLLHPLAGAHTGLLGLSTMAFATWMSAAKREHDYARGLRIAVRTLALPATLFGGFIYFAWIAPGGNHEYDLAFMLDFARFRSPHHHLPSQFSLGVYAAFACFVAAMLLAWRQWLADDATDHALAHRVGICVLTIFGLLVGGYIFVELLPTRMFVMAQTFRLVFIVKWIGLMLFAATAARAFKRAHAPGAGATGWIVLLGTGPFQPGFALFGQLADLARTKFARPVPAIPSREAPNPNRDREGATHNDHAQRSASAESLIAAASLLIASIAMAILWRAESLNETLALVTGGAIILWYGAAQVAWRRPAGALVGISAMIVVAALAQPDHASADGSTPSRFAPILTLAGGQDSRDPVARFVRDHTPPDAVLLTPPYFGRFRVLARRALVVDYKCMPYDAAGYARWRQRLLGCYGEVNAPAEQAVIVMKNHYIWITQERILDVAEAYGADYAVLYKNTPNDWPVLYRDERFKLVAIPQSDARTRERGTVARAGGQRSAATVNLSPDARPVAADAPPTFP